MSERTRDKDVLAIRTAIVCVGLSGVFLGAFAWAASAGKVPWAMVASAAVTGLIVASLGVARRPTASLSRAGRVLGFWVLSALLVLELMVPLNYAGARRHAKWDWTEGRIRSLSDRTLKVLERVEKPLRVTAFFVPADPEQAPFYNAVKDLLDEYRRVNPNIIVEHVDPSRDAERVKTLSRELDIQHESQFTNVFFRYEGARKEVPVMSLVRMMPGADVEHPRADQIGFVGEQEFTSAILEITEKKRKELWFVTGRGEVGPDTPGFSRVASELRSDNYRLVSFGKLAEGVPDNCTVLVILQPKPTSPYDDREQAALARYLETGGRLFVGVGGGRPCGLEPLLGDFGINMGRNVIVDYSSNSATETVPVAVAGWHETVRNLRNYRMVFETARSVEPMPRPPEMMAAPAAEAYPLLGTGRSCWAESDVDLLAEGRAAFDPATDKRGPLVVAVGHEQPDRLPNGEELPPEVPRRRIIAVGSGDFMTDTEYRHPPPANVQFFLNSVNWLAGKEGLISIPPKRFDFRPMNKLEEPDFRRVFWLAVVAMPAAVLVLGSVIWLVRRRG